MYIAQFNTKTNTVYVTEVSTAQSIGKVRASSKKAIWKLIQVNIAYKMMVRSGKNISIQFENDACFTESVVMNGGKSYTKPLVSWKHGSAMMYAIG